MNHWKKNFHNFRDERRDAENFIAQAPSFYDSPDKCQWKLNEKKALNCFRLFFFFPRFSFFVQLKSDWCATGLDAAPKKQQTSASLIHHNYTIFREHRCNDTASWNYFFGRPKWILIASEPCVPSLSLTAQRNQRMGKRNESRRDIKL